MKFLLKQSCFFEQHLIKASKENPVVYSPSNGQYFKEWDPVDEEAQKLMEKHGHKKALVKPPEGLQGAVAVSPDVKPKPGKKADRQPY